MSHSQSKKNVVFSLDLSDPWGVVGWGWGAPLISEMQETDDAVGMLSVSPGNSWALISGPETCTCTLEQT